MRPINILDLNNAQQDVAHIAEIATSTSAVAVDRAGNIKPTVRGAVNTLASFNPRGPFIAGAAYAMKDVYTSGGYAYVALVEHTSTSVVSDLAAGKVVLHQGATREELAAIDGATKIGFGAEGRRVGDKLIEITSPQDKGAKGTGTADDSAAVLAALQHGLANFVAGARHLSKNVILDRASFAFGPAALVANAADQSMVIVANPADINALVKGAVFMGMTFEDMPNATSDNWAALHFNTAEGGIAAFCRFEDVWTAIRSAYYLGGAVSTNNLLIGNTIVNARNMAIELIQSKYNRTIGNTVHNNGSRVGLHGLRWAYGVGNQSTGDSLRDRGSSGISIQVGSTHCLAVGTFIENSGQSGVEVDSATNWEGSHILGPMVVKDSVLDGFDLDFISGCRVSGIVDTTGGAGLRLSSTPTQGKHMIDLQIKRAGGSAALIRSDKNFVRILVDANTAGTPVSIAGSNNLVIVLCADTTVTNTVFVAGSNNTVIIQEAGTGVVGLRVDGNGNSIFGRIKGNLSVGGDGNDITCSVGGNVTINAGADNNRLAGSAAGTVADNGTGNHLSGLVGGNTRGSTAVTTIADGTFSVAHGCKKAPVRVHPVARANEPYVVTLISTSVATFTGKVWSAVTGAPVANTALTIDWEATI